MLKEYSKHICIRADRTNELFTCFVSQLKPNPTVLKLYETVLLDIRGDVMMELKNEIRHVQHLLSEKRKQIVDVEDLMVRDTRHVDRYSKILSRYEEEEHELELRVEILETQNRADIKPKLHYVISLINNVVMYINDAPLEVKFKLIGSMFPEKIEFDGKSYRTKKLNMVLDLIYNQTRELRASGHEKRGPELTSPQFCTPNRAVLEPILTDLDKLYQMRFWIPEPGKPISIQWLRSQGLI